MVLYRYVFVLVLYNVVKRVKQFKVILLELEVEREDRKEKKKKILAERRWLGKSGAGSRGGSACGRGNIE